MTVGVRGGLSFYEFRARALLLPYIYTYIYARFSCLRPARLRSRRPRCLDVGPCFAEFGELARKVFGRFLTTSSSPSSSTRHLLLPPPFSLLRCYPCISRIAFIKRSRIPVSFNPLFYGYRDYANTRCRDSYRRIALIYELSTRYRSIIDCSFVAS